MKRIIALATATFALVACTNPTSPGKDVKPDAAQAKASLHAASKAPMVSGKLAAN
ncbi:MAG: hypothetical protein ABI877_00715 [Gemmatimonadaceae bacterium]